MRYLNASALVALCAALAVQAAPVARNLNPPAGGIHVLESREADQGHENLAARQFDGLAPFEGPTSLDTLGSPSGPEGAIDKSIAARQDNGLTAIGLPDALAHSDAPLDSVITARNSDKHCKDTVEKATTRKT